MHEKLSCDGFSFPRGIQEPLEPWLPFFIGGGVEPRETLLKDVPKMVNQFEKKTQLKFYVNTNKKTGAKTTRFYFNESDTK